MFSKQCRSFIAAGLVVLAAFPSRAATINVPCDWGSIANALTRAREGDVVQIEAGTAVAGNLLTVDRGVSFTVRGSGTNQTTLVSSGGAGIWIRSSSPRVFTISDLNIVGSPQDGGGFLITGPNPGSARPMKGPTHFYNIRMTNVVGRGMSVGGGDAFGLIDHCYFETPAADANFTSISFFGNEYYSWATPIPLGSTNAVYVEDCYFKTQPGAGGNGFFDCYNGAQVVLRHNVFDGTANNGAHGYDSQVTSVRTGEIYDNTFTNITAGGATLLDWRGGTLLWYRNKVYAPGAPVSAVLPLLKYYRGCDGVVPTMANWANIPQVLRFSTNFVDGSALQLINQPYYTFKARLAGGVPREVLLGATLAQSISNLVSCINLDPAGAGRRYSSATVTSDSGRNPDVKVVSFDGTSLTLSNILDGTGPFSWPAAFQHGVIRMTKYSNAGVTLFPCYSWSNTVNGTPFGFAIGFDTYPCNGHNYVTNLLQLNRDYFMDTAPGWSGPPAGYSALVYPHPLTLVDGGSPPPRR